MQLFRCFAVSLTSRPPCNLRRRIRRFLAQVKLLRLFAQNRETAKQLPISKVNAGTYLFHPFFGTAGTVASVPRRCSVRDGAAVHKRAGFVPSSPTDFAWASL